MKTIYKTILILGLYFIFLLSDLSLNQNALAESINPEKAAQKADKAADTIVQEGQKRTAKEIFGDYPETNEMIDKAREKASKKLKKMADKAEGSENPEATLKPNEEHFLKNLD